MLLDIFLLSLWTGIEPMYTGYQQFDDKVWLINQRAKTVAKKKKTQKAKCRKKKKSKQSPKVLII